MIWYEIYIYKTHIVLELSRNPWSSARIILQPLQICMKKNTKPGRLDLRSADIVCSKLTVLASCCERSAEHNTYRVGKSTIYQPNSLFPRVLKNPVEVCPQKPWNPPGQYQTPMSLETPEKGQNFITELSEPLEALTERQRTVARQARLQPDPHRSSWSLNWHVWGSLCDEMMLSWNYADLKTFFLLVCLMILNTQAFIAQDGAKAE